MSDSTNHGGKRKNAGRPKGEVTRMVRVPLGCLEHVKFIISSYKLGDSSLVSNEQKMKVMAEKKVRDRKKNRNVNSQSSDLSMNEITSKVKERKTKSHDNDVAHSSSNNQIEKLINNPSLDKTNHPNIKTIPRSTFDKFPRTERKVMIKEIKKGKLKIIEGK